MVFVAAGLVTGIAGGSIVAGIEGAGAHGELEIAETARHVAEIALVLLFNDAARIDVGALRSSSRLQTYDVPEASGQIEVAI